MAINAAQQLLPRRGLGRGESQAGGTRSKLLLRVGPNEKKLSCVKIECVKIGVFPSSKNPILVWCLRGGKSSAHARKSDLLRNRHFGAHDVLINEGGAGAALECNNPSEFECKNLHNYRQDTDVPEYVSEISHKKAIVWKMTHLMSPQNRRYGPIFVIFGHKNTEFTITDAMATTRNVHLAKCAILILLRSVVPLKIELHVGICRIRGQC